MLHAFSSHHISYTSIRGYPDALSSRYSAPAMRGVHIEQFLFFDNDLLTDQLMDTIAEFIIKGPK